jgi:hypothetical protein
MAAAANSITIQHAIELVQQALGDRFTLTRQGGWWHVFDRTELKASGRTVREAVEAAGVDVPEAAAAPTPYIQVGPKVLKDGKLVAGAVSNTAARLIVNALNNYTPGRRGS